MAHTSCERHQASSTRSRLTTSAFRSGQDFRRNPIGIEPAGNCRGFRRCLNQLQPSLTTRVGGQRVVPRRAAC
jgi:hypothetical protein